LIDLFRRKTRRGDKITFWGIFRGGNDLLKRYKKNHSKTAWCEKVLELN